MIEMAKLTRKQLDEEIKVRFLEGVQWTSSNVGEEVLRVGSNEIALPVVDAEGENAGWCWLSKCLLAQWWWAYDGYSMKEDYEMKLAEKAAKAKRKPRKPRRTRQSEKPGAAKAKEKQEGPGRWRNPLPNFYI